MSSDQDVAKTATTVFSSVLSILFGQWQPILSLLAKIFGYIAREKPNGLFEILDYDSTLELADAQGHLAISSRRQKVRFLQDHVIAFQDHAWGDGEVLADYKISPGVVVDKYKEGDRWNILVSLRETRSKGDVEEFYIQRTTQNAFTQEVEWYQTEVWLPTRHLKLTVVFPSNRFCRRAWLIQRSNNKSTKLGPEHFSVLPDGRHLVFWEKDYPKRSEVYTLQWEW